MKRVLRFAKNHQATFEAIRDGRKSVETRAGSPNYATIQPGDELVLVCNGQRCSKIVKTVQKFASIEELLSAIPVSRIFPDQARSVEEAAAIYHRFPGYRERIAEFGLLAFEV